MKKIDIIKKNFFSHHLRFHENRKIKNVEFYLE